MKKVFEFLFAMTFGVVLLIIGLISNVFFWKKGKVVKTILKTFRELGILFLDFLEMIAIYVDRLGNLILENLFEFIFIKREHWTKTLFGKSKITISASFGQALYYSYLNKRGIKFAQLLDKVLGENHCIDAYSWHLIKKDFQNNNQTGIS